MFPDFNEVNELRFTVDVAVYIHEFEHHNTVLQVQRNIGLLLDFLLNGVDEGLG